MSGAADAVDSLAALAGAIPAIVRGTGAQPDRRPWRPHLTIARARHGDARPVVDVLADYAGPAWDATSLVLIRSTGGPHPSHAVVHEVPLNAPSGAG